MERRRMKKQITLEDRRASGRQLNRMMKLICEEVYAEQKLEERVSLRKELYEHQRAPFDDAVYRHLLDDRFTDITEAEKERAKQAAKKLKRQAKENKKRSREEEQKLRVNKRRRQNESNLGKSADEPGTSKAKLSKWLKKRIEKSRKALKTTAEAPGAYQTIIHGSPVSVKEESTTPRIKSEAVDSPQVKLEYISPLRVKMEGVNSPQMKTEDTTPSRIKIENTTSSPTKMLDALPFRVKMDDEEV